MDKGQTCLAGAVGGPLTGQRSLPTRRGGLSQAEPEAPDSRGSNRHQDRTTRTIWTTGIRAQASQGPYPTWKRRRSGGGLRESDLAGMADRDQDPLRSESAGVLPVRGTDIEDPTGRPPETRRWRGCGVGGPESLFDTFNRPSPSVRRVEGGARHG